MEQPSEEDGSQLSDGPIVHSAGVPVFVVYLLAFLGGIYMLNPGSGILETHTGQYPDYRQPG